MKKLLYAFLVLTLSISLVACSKGEEPELEPEKEDEETVTITDDNGVEHTYTKRYAEDISKAFTILDEYTWEELRLLDEKEKYLWGPEDDYKWLNLGDFAIETVPVHAGVEVVNGDGTVGLFYVDTYDDTIIIWDDEIHDYVFLDHK